MEYTVVVRNTKQNMINKLDKKLIQQVYKVIPLKFFMILTSGVSMAITQIALITSKLKAAEPSQF